MIKNSPYKQKSIDKIILILVSLAQILFLYVIIRKALPKPTIILFIAPVAMYNYYLFPFLKGRIPEFVSKKKKAVYFAIAGLLALIFYKSISLETVFVNEGMMSVPYILGAVAFYFQMVMISSVLLESAAISVQENRKGKFNPFYALPALVIFTFLYLAYFPGLCSADSLYVWTQVGRNIYSDAHPIIYMFLVKGLRLIWNDIAVVALFQIILSLLVYAFVISELGKMGVPKWMCWVLAVAIPLIPTNALYTVTFWKDVPYTLGLITLSVLILKCFTGDYYYKKKALPQIFAVSLFTLFMRHNALFSVMLPLFFLGIYYIFKKDKKAIIKTLILGICLVVAYFGIKSAVFASLDSNLSQGEYTGKSFVRIGIPKTIATQQIIYTEDVAGTSFTPEEKELFDKFFVREEIAAHKEKYSPGLWQYYHKPTLTVNNSVIGADESSFWRYYFKLCVRFPRSMFAGYEKLTSINWASSQYGPVAYRGITDAQMEGFEDSTFRPVIKRGMNYKLDKLFFNYTDSALSGLLWRPAFAFILMLLCLWAAFRKHGVGMVFLALPVIFNQLTYFIVIASQDTRYTYINYTLFLIMLTMALLTDKKMKPSDAENKKTVSA